MSPWALLGGVLLTVCALGGAYLQGRADGRDGEIAAHATQAQLAAAAGQEAASAVAAGLAGLKVTNQTIIQRQAKEVLREKVFVECRSGARAVQLLNAAASAGSAPDGAAADPGMPGASAAAR